MGSAKKFPDDDTPDDQGKRRLTLTRLLIWAEREAVDLHRSESARHINLAIGGLYENPGEQGGASGQPLH